MAISDSIDEICAIVKKIPRGKVMSYGQVGDEVGAGARLVGRAMAESVETDVPWQRVVGVDGYLRIKRRSPELGERQRSLLQEEGVEFRPDGCVDIDKHRYILEH